MRLILLENVKISIVSNPVRKNTEEQKTDNLPKETKDPKSEDSEKKGDIKEKDQNDRENNYKGG